MDEDSLVATRARRANAGSRLKLLIELEERASGVQQLVIYNEDDENVQLLFQEDENDEEFEEPDVSGEENENSQDEEDDLPKEEGDDDNNGSETEVAVNSDEMLSDSDLSVSEDDDSEGERELEKEERAKKRKHKLKTIIPAIKKARPAPVKTAPKPKVKHSELLLDSERRASSRKSALQNKQELLEKLQEDESRRAKLAPVVRVKERELTQEERLAEAKETETQNVISLNMFLQQEIVKKERQKLLFQQRRPKLRNVVRLYSAETYVTPLDEIEDARHVQDLFERKKRGRRRKNPYELEPKRPGDVDELLPYYQREMAERRRLEAERAEEKRRLEEARAIKRKKLEEERAERKRLLEEEREARKKAKEERLKEYDVDISNDPNAITRHKSVSKDQLKDAEADVEAGEDDKNDTLAVKEVEKVEGEQEENDKMDEDMLDKPDEEDHGEKAKLEDSSDKMDIDDPSETDKLDTDNTKESEDSKSEPDSANVDERTVSPSVEPIEHKEVISSETPAATEVKEETTEEVKTEPEVENSEKVEKKVTFADDNDGSHGEETDVKAKVEEPDPVEEPVEEPKSRSATPIYRSHADGSIFEGPVQHVARNLVFLLNFDEEDRWGLTDIRIKSALFGEEVNLVGARRYQDVKTIFRSSLRLNNPYAAPKEEKEDELLIPVTKITEESGLFDALQKLPRFGDKEIYEEEEEIENFDDTSEIRIRTEAPTGLYLPNGNKKLCLISGKEVRYFDPATGLPYGNKDDYQIIKTVELGIYPWYSIPKDQNTYGAVEIYLNKREGARHAIGVPEGFDGY